MTISEKTNQELGKMIQGWTNDANNLALDLAILIVQQESERLSDCSPQFVAEIIIERIERLRK